MADNTKNIFDELKEFYEKISPILKLTSLVASAFSIIISFTFAMVYMRDNDFFSYEIFSINFMWIFLFIGIFFVAIHGLYIFGAYLRITQTSKCWSNIFIIMNGVLVIFVFPLFCSWLFNNFINPNFVVIFCFIAIAITCAFRLAFRDCEFGKNIIILLFIAMSLVFIAACCIFYKSFDGHKEVFILFAFLLVLFILFEAGMAIISFEFSATAKSYENTNNFFNNIRLVLIAFFVLFFIILGLGGSRIYKEFLKSINLASDHVEIYLKDKNESINGELIFDDGKYAYVKFNRTVSNCGDVSDSCIKTIRKKVPSEDVSIITRVKKDTKASVPK